VTWRELVKTLAERPVLRVAPSRISTPSLQNRSHLIMDLSFRTLEIVTRSLCFHSLVRPDCSSAKCFIRTKYWIEAVFGTRTANPPRNQTFQMPRIRSRSRRIRYLVSNAPPRSIKSTPLRIWHRGGSHPAGHRRSHRAKCSAAPSCCTTQRH
jgi:hypothetical protein